MCIIYFNKRLSKYAKMLIIIKSKRCAYGCLGDYVTNHLNQDSCESEMRDVNKNMRTTQVNLDS